MDWWLICNTHIPHFWSINSVNVFLCLSYHCILNVERIWLVSVVYVYGSGRKIPRSLIHSYTWSVIGLQLLSHVWHFATPWTATHQASLSLTISWSLLKLMSIESVMPSNHLALCHPILLPSTFSSFRVFSNGWALPIRWPKYWGFNFSVSPSNEYSELISFGIDWLDLLSVQGTLKSLL